MNVTADTARMLMCPQKALLSTEKPMQECLCVGPGCMAWRWSQPRETREVVMTREQISAASGIPLVAIDAPQIAPVDRGAYRLGYCGLAGFPAVPD